MTSTGAEALRDLVASNLVTARERTELLTGSVGDVSVKCFEAAEAGLGRMAAPAEVKDAVTAFAERYVSRYRCPADDRLDEARQAASS